VAAAGQAQPDLATGERITQLRDLLPAVLRSPDATAGVVSNPGATRCTAQESIMSRLASAAVLSLTALFTLSAWADDGAQPRWQARVQLSNVDAGSDPAPHLGGSRILSANLLGDYYLTSSGFTSLQGGLRATGGLLMGPLSMSQSSGGLALGSGGSGALSAGRRSLVVSGPDAYALEPSSNLSYVGIGSTGRLKSSGFAFSADFGLMSGSVGAMRLGRSPAQGFEDAMRDLRFKPLLQLGLAYSY
jgi:hypothetical protein